MFEYRHNKCVGHTPLRSYSPFLSTAKIMETKKTWEYVSLRAYPINQALALPLHKDKQRKACPRRAIYIHYDLTIPDIHIRKDTLPNGYTLLYI